jgi:SsrA-binding protein
MAVKPNQNLAENRRARFDHEIVDTLEAGIELRGHEVKAVKSGRFELSGSYALIRGGELWLLNSKIPPYQAGNTPEGYDPERTRRLLLKKEEIVALTGKLKEKGWSLIPLRAYLKHGIVKIALGLGRARNKGDKRELLKKRDIERETQRKF